MSRPVYQPSYARTDRKLGFSADQLFRRPAPQGVGGLAIYEIKVFEDAVDVIIVDDAFVWEIPEDLDQASVVKVEAFISTAGADDVVIQIRQSDPCDVGTDILSTPITIDAGECNSRDASVQPVISGLQWPVAWGEHLHIDVDSDGDGAKGLGVIVTLASSALASVVLEGAQGPQGDPGGIVNWLGEWDAGTTYNLNDAVSHNGSSYVSLTTNTNVEPGVDVGWESDWMVLSEGAPDIGYGTSLPGSPANGDEYILVDSTSNPTYLWRLRFNSSEATYKWEFQGGNPFITQIGTQGGSPENTTSASYVDLSTSGPTFTVPNAGDYELSIGFEGDTNGAGSGVTQAWMTIKVGAAAAADAQGVMNRNPEYVNVARTYVLTGLAASTVLLAKYKSTDGSNTCRFTARWLRVQPRRII